MRHMTTQVQLSDEQSEAVAFDGPALVVAGAGSGKTRTLTAKIAHLIHSGYSSKRILAITFTNKAAGEMKQRLVQMTGLPVDEFPWVRTFHSASFKILKQHCRLLGICPAAPDLCGISAAETVQGDPRPQILIKNFYIPSVPRFQRQKIPAIRRIISTGIQVMHTCGWPMSTNCMKSIFLKKTRWISTIF
jgi:superfamily I DNA/RNA helicase